MDNGSFNIAAHLESRETAKPHVVVEQQDILASCVYGQAPLGKIKPVAILDRTSTHIAKSTEPFQELRSFVKLEVSTAG